MDKYSLLRATLNPEQQKLLMEIDDENNNSKIEQYEKGLAEGKKQGLKTAVEVIVNVIT